MIKNYKIKTLTYLYQHFCTFRLNAKINNNNKLITNNRVFEWDKQIQSMSLSATLNLLYRNLLYRL